MPIGIIIMGKVFFYGLGFDVISLHHNNLSAVLGIAVVIANKCCGVKIDPIKRIKKFWNDLRDRWRWLDKENVIHRIL